MSAEPEPRRDIVVVLGMHRSGTSALAGILARHGCTLPQEVMPANDFNPKGYYESLLTYNLNDAIFRSQETSWDDWQVFPQDWYGTADMDASLAEGRKVLQNEFQDAPISVLKDPRICRLMPFWSQLFDKENLKPTYLLIHRNPIEVANSLLRREGWPISVGFLLWLRHVLEGEFGSRGRARSFTSYERLLTDWRAVIERFQSDTGLFLPLSSDAAAEEVTSFLTSDLRHSSESAETLAAHPDATPWVQTTFEIMERWAQDGEAEADYQTLDGIRGELDAVTPMFGPMVQYLRAERRKDAITMGEMREAHLAERRHASEKYEELLSSSREEITALETILAAEQQKLATYIQTARADLLRQRANFETELAETLQAHRSHSDIRAVKQQEQIASLEVLRDRLQADLHHRTEALDRMTEERNRSDAEREALYEEVRRHQGRVHDLEHSTSWKITGPLRRLIRLVKRAG